MMVSGEDKVPIFKSANRSPSIHCFTDGMLIALKREFKEVKERKIVFYKRGSNRHYHIEY